MRRRLLYSILFVSAVLFGIAWIDNKLLLQNRDELDARVRLVLEHFFPDNRPEIRHIDFDFPSCVIEGIRFSEKGSQRPLLSIERLEVTLSLAHWFSPREVTIRGLRGELRLSKDGKLNVASLIPERKGPPSADDGFRPGSPVLVAVEDAQVRFEDEDTSARTRLTCERASVTIHPDGRIVGEGIARAGALVEPLSPFAAGATPIEGESLLYRELLPFVRFEVERKADGRVSIPVDVEKVAVGPVLRSVLPRYVQEVIWDELNPTGNVDARVTLRLRPEGDSMAVRPEVNISAKGSTLRPKGFPYPIHDIAGRFEVSPGIISWEDVTASLDGEGKITHGRGSFFLGRPNEKITLFISIQAQDVPLDETLRQAMPADIRAVYDQFGIQGLAGKSQVVIFKGELMEDPQLSIRSELDGRQSAAFVDYPIRYTPERGTFVLKEGGNVEIACDGRLGIGGTARVEARVVHGDLIHVHVTGDGVPVNEELVQALDPGVRRMVAPFHPTSGKAGFDVVVAQSDPHGRPVPHAVVNLDGVSVTPEIFPYKLRTDGRLEVTPT